MTDRPVDHIEHLRRPLLDTARECFHASGGNVTVMRRALQRATDVLDTTADRLWQAAIVEGIDIAGDLTLADRLAACQHAWNAGDAATAMDRLLEAHSHIRREMGVSNAG